MRFHAARPLWIVLTCLFVAGEWGCGAGAPSNLSPSPEQDPERHRKAVAYQEELIRKNQEAERKAMSGRRVTPLEP